MNRSGRAATALLAAVLTLTGVSITIAQAGPVGLTTLAAPLSNLITVDAAAARSAIGVAPRVDSPASNRVASMLGTVFTFRWARTVVDVQVTTVDTTTVGDTVPTRHIQAAVNYTATTGAVSYATTDFVIIDQNGTRYPAATTGTPSGPLPLLTTGTLTSPATTTGVVMFDVPTTADALVVAYVPAPSHSIVGTWMLSAP